MADAELGNIGVYKITNIANGKIYVGSTGVSYRIRWGNHKSELNNNKHINTHLQSAFNKYGKDCFVFEVLEIVNEKNKLIDCEQKWIDSLDTTNPVNGYNLCPCAKSVAGIKRSQETRDKISKSNIGKKYSSEQRKRMSEGQKALYQRLGKNHWLCGRRSSDETKAKLSASHIGLSRGEKNKKSKLTENDVVEIYNLIFNSRLTQKDIARMFSVSRETISGIKTGRLWGWFTSELNSDWGRAV